MWEGQEKPRKGTVSGWRFFPLTCCIFQIAFNAVALKASWNVRNENKGKRREQLLTPAPVPAPEPFSG